MMDDKKQMTFDATFIVFPKGATTCPTTILQFTTIQKKSQQNERYCIQEIKPHAKRIVGRIVGEPGNNV